MSISWNQNNRCPNCGGFAGAYKDQKRCRGFAHRDGQGFFCEQPNGRMEPGLSYNWSGYDLYYHSYEQE